MALSITKSTPWEEGLVTCASSPCPWHEALPAGPQGRGYTNALKAAKAHLATEPGHRVDAVIVRTVTAQFRMEEG